MLEPVEGGADVFDFPFTSSVFAFAQSGAAEVEAQYGKSEGLERFHGVKNDLVVQRAAEERVGMTDYGCMSCVWRSGIQQRFEAANWAVQEERSDAEVFEEHGCKSTV